MAKVIGPSKPRHGRELAEGSQTYVSQIFLILPLTLNLSPVTHLTNFMFDGARADLSKNLSINPAFQISHSFNLGSQVAAPSYNFGAVYATNSVTCKPLPASHIS